MLCAGPGATAERYDPATVSPVGDGTVLVAGGLVRQIARCGFRPCSNLFRSLASAKRFAPESAGFTATGSLHAARDEHTATVLADGTPVLIAGGVQRTVILSPIPPRTSTAVLSSAEIYK